MTATTRTHPTPGVWPAAAGAVGMWSAKPLLVTLVASSLGFVELYLLAAGFAVAASVVVFTFMHRTIVAVARDARARKGVLWSLGSGAFLALWYYGFYRALYGASKVDATIISFTWPVIAVVALRILAPSMAPRLRLWQWGLILLALLGACLTAGAPSGGSNPDIIWAFVAAFGSGMYLPFAVRGTVAFERAGVSKAVASMLAIGVANVSALACVGLAAGWTVTWPPLAPGVVAVAAVIGVGTYLIAEVAWTWAVQAGRSLSLAALPYLSPALSVVALALLFDDPVSVGAWVGLVLVVLSNVTLQVGPATLTQLRARTRSRNTAHAADLVRGGE